MVDLPHLRAWTHGKNKIKKRRNFRREYDKLNKSSNCDNILGNTAMANRPNLGDIRAPSHETLRNGIPSPRIEHYDGEVPPALSPLDAFAAQGRLLARQLEESARRDCRLSRLPPSSVARSLSRPRPGYFRSLSSGDGSNSQENNIERRPTQKNHPEVEELKFRPMSEHPRFSNVSNPYTEASFVDDDEGDEDASSTPKHGSTILQSGSRSLDVPRAESPEEDPSLQVMPDQGPPRFYAAAPSVGVSLAAPSMNSSTDSAMSRFLIPRSLAPPGSPYSRPSSSSRGTQPESSDDDYSSSNAGSTFSKPRKLSSGSAMSVPHSPMSTNNPMPRSRPRSPSQSSEASNTGSHLQRPSLNFSRPMSRSSTNLSGSGVAAATADLQCQGSRASVDRGVKLGPLAVPNSAERSRPSVDEPSSAMSYTYAKYALPRGRQVSRDSTVFAGLQTPHFEWKEPLFKNTPKEEEQHERPARTPTPPPSQDESGAPTKARSLYEAPVSDRRLLTPEPSTPSGRSISPESAKQSPKTSKSDSGKDDASSSAASNSTLRPETARSTGSAGSGSIPSSAEDHLAIGIKCHEKGSLNESTYHLRVAAKQNHPTAMLLYALACRHGWGMRPNQTEGVRWLRKAMDSVGLEMMEDTSNTSTPARFREMQKAYRAQFALSVYELGVSHLNGWGIEQDKALALRCFELAGQWGDADALAEAGYCYAQGAGCKKDLKKAAKFYRQAESKGINMVGNSWYVVASDACCTRDVKAIFSPRLTYYVLQDLQGQVHV